MGTTSDTISATPPSVTSEATATILSPSALDAVGGHSAKLGGVYTMWKEEDETHGPVILKPISFVPEDGITARGMIEKEFYDKIQGTPFAQFIPKYFGTMRRSDHNDQDFLVLENVAARFAQPSVCDIKLGRYTADPYATEKKRKSEFNKYPHQETIGFRFTGGRFWDFETCEYTTLEREWCLSRQPSDYPEALNVIFKTDRLKQLIPFLVEKLEAFQQCLINHPSWKCYSSSLLIIHESDDGIREWTRDDIGVWCIDFAHAYELTDGEKDDDYLFGLKRLIEFLKQL